jgi:hypothetical protein
MQKQSSSPLKKVHIDKICRTFNLVFNQVAMYHAKHPAAVRTIDQFYETLRQGLAQQSPIVIIYNRDQFYFEDDAFDSRINTLKMGGHFKKAEIQSVSFSKGLSNDELKQFVRIFSDLKRYPEAGAMKSALETAGVGNVRINYIFYKKMTADDEVVDRDQARQFDEEEKSDDGGDKGGFTGPTTEDILEMIAANVMFEELEKTMSLRHVVSDPAHVSTQIIENDLAACRQMAGLGEGPGGGPGEGPGGGPGEGPGGGPGEGPGGGPGGGPGEGPGTGQQPGHAITYQLQEIRRQVDQALTQPSADVDLQELAQGVYDLKKQLLDGIEAQKEKGVVYIAEEEIRQEADEITDEVMTRLIIEEYGRGGISIQRLAQIIMRLIPETIELQRLLPRLKKALLAEGMPLSDFLALVQELKNELQSDELSYVLEQSAEEIGLDPEELIREVMENPAQAAELICLAAEIKQGTGDETPFQWRWWTISRKSDPKWP